MSNPSYEEEMWNATERFWNSSSKAQRLIVLCNVEVKNISIRNLEVRPFDMLPTSIQIDIRQEFGETLKEAYSYSTDGWWTEQNQREWNNQFEPEPEEYEDWQKGDMG